MEELGLRSQIHQVVHIQPKATLITTASVETEIVTAPMVFMVIAQGPHAADTTEPSCRVTLI